MTTASLANLISPLLLNPQDKSYISSDTNRTGNGKLSIGMEYAKGAFHGHTKMSLFLFPWKTGTRAAGVEVTSLWAWQLRREGCLCGRPVEGRLKPCSSCLVRRKLLLPSLRALASDFFFFFFNKLRHFLARGERSTLGLIFLEIGSFPRGLKTMVWWKFEEGEIFSPSSFLDKIWLEYNVVYSEID